MWRRKRGVTVMPYLIVIALIAGAAWFLWSRYKASQAAEMAETRRLTAMLQMKSLERALWQYRLANDTFPSQQQGLNALRAYANVTAIDPWGRAYVYRNPGARSEDPEIVTYGADGKPGGIGEDADLVSSEIKH